ncbi:hypothetical protein VZO05_07595 [Aggregatilineales bacterium SYSU G02658]
MRTQIMAQASTLLGAGLFVGAAAGVAAVVFGGDEAAARDLLVLGYGALGVVLALVLAMTFWLSVDDSLSLGPHHRPSQLYESLTAGLLTSVTAALLGVVGASGAYLFPAFGFSAIFGGFASVEFQQSVVQAIGVPGFLLLLGGVAAVGVAATVVVHLQGRDD